MALKAFAPTLHQKVNAYARMMIRKGTPIGHFCTSVDEPVPSFDKAECEKVYKGNNDSWIVLGRDRTSNLATGMGGSGYTSCGMIDLVTGRLATFQAKLERNGEPALEKKQKVNPNFAADAARIYITQKTEDIDDAFGFVKTKKPHSKNKSAIGIKADHTRIIGRESVRIYAGQAQWDGFGGDGETCSNGDPIAKGAAKIELIGAYGDENLLEPVVLGNKLQVYLKDEVMDRFRTLNTDLFMIYQQLSNINKYIIALSKNPIAMRDLALSIERRKIAFQAGIDITTSNSKFLDTMGYPGEGSFVSNSVFTT